MKGKGKGWRQSRFEVEKFPSETFVPAVEKRRRDSVRAGRDMESRRERKKSEWKSPQKCSLELEQCGCVVFPSSHLHPPLFLASSSFSVSHSTLDFYPGNPLLASFPQCSSLFAFSPRWIREASHHGTLPTAVFSLHCGRREALAVRVTSDLGYILWFCGLAGLFTERPGESTLHSQRIHTTFRNP